MQHSIIVSVIGGVIVSLILFIGGYLIGEYRERKKLKGKNLEQYDFYPFDANYMTDEVMKSMENVETFFRKFLKTDMVLEENILSKEEYDKALKGKRHWKQAV
jgi:hypothetical protein